MHPNRFSLLSYVTSIKCFIAMKKYLVKGALALFGGAFLFSCAEKESEYVPLAQQKVQAFEDVFKEIYGDIDPYQDWGFSSGKVEVDTSDPSQVVEVVDLGGDVAVTRTAAFGGMNALLAFRGGTRAHNANGNEWFKKYDVPYALTWHQKDLVRQYFQQVKDPGGDCPEWSTFFVQQVYKGHTNVTSDSKTTEQYVAGNGDIVIGSNKMNKLTCANKAENGNEHINNYNNADCSGRSDIKHSGVYKDGYTPFTEDNFPQDKGWENCVNENNNNLKEFSDTIMLMEDCSTKYFGYENSLQSSYVYNDMFTCVYGDDIMKWARDNNKTIYDDGDVSGMYFVGFDYEADLKHNLTDRTQSNSYLVTESTQSTGGSFEVPNKNDGKYYVDGARDHYYSDWIVRIVPGNPEPQPTYKYPEEGIDDWTQIESGRVFCEDLGRATREDLDYNDVVFDAIIFQNHTKYTKWKETYVNNVLKEKVVIEGPTEATKYYAYVEILAAGGTIPITVAGQQVHGLFKPKAADATMINTRDNNSTAFGSYEERDPVQLGTISKEFEAKLPDGTKKNYNLMLYEIEKPADNQFIKTIQIVSSFDNAQVSELKGEKGGAPQKFMAPIGTKWTSERKNISLAYPGFDAWVKGGSAPWSNVNTNYVYDKTQHSNSVQLPLAMKARRTIDTGEETALWTGANTFGDSWNLANMSATLDLDKFYPGDRLRFWGVGIKDEAWITVIIGDIKPYFVDSDFPNYVVDADGKKEARTTGCVEVMLDENSAALLNSKVSEGKVTFQVQGRNFTLSRICRVTF